MTRDAATTKVRALGLGLVTAAALALGTAARAQWSAPLELVQSKAVETELDDPALRNTRAVWLDMLRGARRSVDLGAFYILDREGEALRGVLEALADAARRGVRVRVICDMRFYATYPAPVDAIDAVPGIDVRKIDIAAYTGNGVMHAKYMVVDGLETFLGSQNFDWKALTHIHEIGVRVRDRGVAAAVTRMFELDWDLAAHPDPSKPPDRLWWEGRQRELAKAGPDPALAPKVTLQLPEGPVTVQPHFSPVPLLQPGMHSEEEALVGLIGSARKFVQVQVMEYSPVENKRYWPTLDNALRAAAVRGAKVQLMVANWSLKREVVPWLESLSRIPGIELRISVIPEASTGFVSFARVEHCKYVVVDGERCYVGTSNWEEGYFHGSRNLGLLMEGTAVARRLERVFRSGWISPYARKLEIGQMPVRPVLNRPGAP